MFVKEKSKTYIWFALIILSVGLFIENIAERVNSYNATVLAFSYKYGFGSRSLIGTIYQGLNDLLPINLNTYAAVNQFVFIITILFTVAILAFCEFVICRVDIEKTGAWMLLFLFVIFTVPTFAGYYNFGRLDLYMVFLDLLGVVLILKDKGLWLLIPIMAAGVMVHQAYVFMYANVLLVLLFFRWMETSEKKYRNAFILCLVTVSVLFLWFNFLGRAIESPYVDEIIKNAKAMTYKHKYHKDVVRAEILGVDLTKEEREYHIRNFIELPFFLCAFSPYIFLLGRIFKKIHRSVYKGEIRKKLGWFAVIVGSLTILPLYVMKVDFGRWTYAVIFYYFIVFMTLLMKHQKQMENVFREVYIQLHDIGSFFPAALVVYGMVFTPFTDLSINALSYWFYSLFGLE